MQNVQHPPERPITVLLAEDNVLMREGLLTLLTLEGDLRVVGQAGNGRQAVTLASKLCPDVVVMDISLPLLNGLEATQQILQALPATKVLVLSSHSADSYIEQVRALGASGYLIKQTNVHLLPKAIREVHRGNAFFCPSVAKSAIRGPKKGQGH
ncbi:response regulator transcription factor [Prosthecobacter sp.]|uniref:response regulator n=1 Tax=Prosthecobacter sp. TaxID=1965333 RepID=UPI002ABCFB82|nr:response regulator transcription factor [Prosthecobacter sp.]MDZ4401164.1 response regulator transcription factor [Prosthecobacter sp.]